MSLKPPQSPTNGFASLNERLAWRPTVDLREFVTFSSELYSSSGVSGSGLLTASWAEANDDGKALLLPPDPVLVTSPINIPATGPQLIGRGRGESVLRAHPDWQGGSPIITHPVAGAGTVATDIVLQDFTIDGNYSNSTEYNTRCELTATYTYGDATVTVDAIPAGFPASGSTARALFDDHNSDDEGFAYTSRTSTQFLGCTPVGSGQRTEAIGQELYWYPAGIIGLFRIYAFTRMSVIRCDFLNGPAYGFGAEGYYVNARGPETDFYAQDSRFNGNGSDGCDIKNIVRGTFIRCEASDNDDTGFDPRCQQVTMVECEAHRNATGINSEGKGALADVYAALSVQASATATSMTFTDSSTLPASGSGHIGVEEIDWTANSGTVVSGITRGMRGTRPAVHAVNSATNVSILVPDTDPDDVPDLFEDFEFATDLIGCHADDNEGTGIALTTGGMTVKHRANVVGGGANRNGARGLLIYGSNRGRLWTTVHGGQYVGNAEGIRCQYVHGVNIFGPQVSDSTGVGDPNGDAIYLYNCSNGGRISGLESRNNAGRPVRMVGNTANFEIDFVGYGNAGGDAILEVGNNNRGTGFRRGRADAGRIKALLPLSDGGPSAATAVLWENFPHTEIDNMALAANTSATLNIWPIWLPEGLVITRMGMMYGSTALTGAQNSFFALYDDALALLVQTPDNTTNGWSASLPFDRPFAASATYTTLREGLFYVGNSIKASGAIPTYGGKLTAASSFTPWSRIVTSNTALTGTAPNPAVALSEGLGIPYIYFK